MSDMPHAPANPLTAALSWLFMALSPSHGRKVVDDDSWEDPRDRAHRLQAALQRREGMRDAVHDLLR